MADANFRKFVPGIELVPQSTSNVSAQGDLDVDSVSTKINYHNGTTSSHVVTESQASQGADRLQNKDLDDSTSAIVDSADTTKKLLFNVTGTTGTSTTLTTTQTANRIINLPDSSGTLIVSGSPGIITNNLLDEGSVWFVDTSDNTKAFKFDVSGATTATSVTLKSNQTANRVLTLPDLTDNLVSRTSVDTLTNKTLTSPVLNTPTADTITGIAGGPLLVQSATNQNLSLQAQGTGVVLLESMTIDANTLTGGNASPLIVSGGTTQNLQLQAGAANLVTLPSNPLQLAQNLQTQRSDDASTTGTQATINPAVSGFIKLTNGSLVSVSGITAGSNGQQLTLTNGTGNSVQILNDDAGASASARIFTGTGATTTLNNNTSIDLIYDTGASRWRIRASVGGPPTISGSRASPNNVTTSITASSTAINQVIFVQGSGAPQTVTSITAGSIIGQQLIIIGRNNTNTVTIQNSSGSIELNGDAVLGLSDVLSLIWDGTAWVETSRN